MRLSDQLILDALTRLNQRAVQNSKFTYFQSQNELQPERYRRANDSRTSSENEQENCPAHQGKGAPVQC